MARKQFTRVFVGMTEGGSTCGHQHESARAARHCIDNHKRRYRFATLNWRVVCLTDADRRRMAA